MARVPGAMNLLVRRALQLAWLAIASSVLLYPAMAQSPDMVLGTSNGAYTLFTPDAVTDAGLARGAASANKIVGINADGDNVVYETPESVVSKGLPSRTGHGGQCVAVNSGEGGFDYVACGSGGAAPLSDATPKALGTAAPGMATKASRDDHVHPPTGLRQLPANPSGSASAFLRGTASGPAWSEGEIAPVLGTGSANDCLRINAAGTAIVWSACPSGGGGGSGGTATVAWTRLGVQVGPRNGVTQRTVSISGDGLASCQAADFLQFTVGFTATSTQTDTPPVFGTAIHRGPGATPGAGATFVADGTISGGLRNSEIYRGHQGISVTSTACTWTINAPAAGGINYRYFQAFAGKLTGGGGGGGGASLSDATPKVESGSGAAGTADMASRDDHVHPARTIPKQPLSSFGTVGTSGQCAKANSSRDGLAYGDCGSPRVLSERDPVAAGTADPGNRTDVSRSDHVHPSAGGGNATPLSDADPADLGIKTPGASSNASRADHVHSQTSFLAVGVPPKSGGTGAIGVSTLAARGDHQHPAPDAGGMAQLPAPSLATKGDLARVNAAGDAYEVADPHAAILSGLPAITGQGGKVLGVNSAATGVEWTAPGGGGDASVLWRRIGDQLSLTTTSTVSDSLNSREVTLCKEADFLAVVFKRTNTTSSVALPRPISVTGDANIKPIDIALFDFSGGRVGVAQFDCYDATNPRIRGDATFGKRDNRMGFYVGNIRGGGGGSSGPSIPTPSAAGAGEFLRVNAAGAAYELADVPTYDSDIDDIDSALGALGRVTADLEVASTETSWATNAVVGAGIAIGTAGANTAPTTGYIRDTIARPNAGWPANAVIFATLPKGSDPTAYRVLEPDVTGSVTLVDAGGSWARVNASRTDADYYRVNTAGQYDGALTLQHRATIVRTRYRGEVVNGELPEIPDDANSKQYALETKGDGSGVEWSNDIFSALNTNAQDIGDALERIGKVDTPGDADASKSTLAAGQVWEIKSCADKSGSRSCTAGFSAERRVSHQLIVHGTGAPNGTSQSFAGTGRLTQHALISGTSYDEFLIVARHVAGNPINTHIRSCRVPGIQGDWLANASHGVTLTGEGGACKIVAPTTGNLTVTWAAPLAGQKIAGDTWRLYGIDWQ